MSQVTNPSVTKKEALNEILQRQLGQAAYRMRVPEIDGYHLHWANDDRGKIESLLELGYTFVERDEVPVRGKTIAGNSEVSQNTDLGSRVSVSVGNDVRAYLLKVPNDVYEQIQAFYRQAADNRESILKRGMAGADNLAEADRNAIFTMNTIGG